MKQNLPQLIILSVLVSSCEIPSTQAGESLTELKPFLQEHCYDCHGAEKQKGDIRLDTLGSDLTDHANLEIWQNVLDQLNLGEMPPEKRPQPTRVEVEPVIAGLTRSLAEAYENARSTGGRTVLRRLNRHELRNTFRDLLYLNGADYRPDAAGSRLTDNNGNGSVERTGTDPLRFFPEDEAEDGFFNLGDKLVMSDFLLKLTLDAAEEVLAQATHLDPKPPTEPRRFAGHLTKGRRNGEHTIEWMSRGINPDYDLMATGYERYGRLSPTDLRGGVGVSARYRISVEVSAHNRQHPWEEMVQLHDKDPFQLCLNIADTKNGGIEGPTSTPLELWTIPADGKKRTYTFEVWMDKTWTPWIGWENGPTDRGFRAEKVVEKYLPHSYRPRPDKKTDKEAHDNWPQDMAKLLHSDGYKGPHLRIHGLTVEPLIETWPPKSHTALYGTGTGVEAEIRHLMSDFARRAFRRPVEPELLEPYVQLVMKQQIEPLVKVDGGLKNLRYRVFEGRWSNLPEFETLEPVAEGESSTGLIDIGVAGRAESFGVVFEGELDAKKAGVYQFEMASDDGGRILVDGKMVVEHDGLHGATLRRGKVRLAPGEHSIRVEYFAYGQPNSFRAGWSGPGFPHTKLSVESLHSAPGKQKPEDAVPLFVRAMRDGYAAMLCSPQFLYLKETAGGLDDHALASRLSYFLWSSMPDDELFALAEEGKLREPEELARQVERMLGDPKSAAFVRHFPSAWLRMDKLGKMPPSGGDFQFYKKPQGRAAADETGDHLLRGDTRDQRQDRALHRFRLHLHEPDSREVDLPPRGHPRAAPAQSEAGRPAAWWDFHAARGDDCDGERGRYVSSDPRHLGSGECARHAASASAARCGAAAERHPRGNDDPRAARAAPAAGVVQQLPPQDRSDGLCLRELRCGRPVA